MKPEPKLQDTAVGLDGELYRPAHTPQTGKSLSDYDTLKSKSRGRFRP
ncbi:MAG: hypothetical protein H6672_14940 [Anaerolineaceae bacterium]|nr:hypothetical protein [Anaerolineaceae bacterium]